MKNAIDYKNGGIYTQLDREGNVYGRDKSVWFQGRALWVFSKAYNVIEKNPEYLKIAQNLYSFLPKCTDEDGRMYFTDDKNGEWYGYLHYDNTPSTTLKGNIFKGPFHIPRLYILMSVLDETGDISEYLK